MEQIDTYSNEPRSLTRSKLISVLEKHALIGQVDVPEDGEFGEY